MPRIDEMPEFRARLNRQTHDLSHKFGFTCTVAHLLPVFHDFLNPGETVELAFNYNLRTQPLQSAAMVDIKTHVEYFFVPMFLLYEPFGSMSQNINDNYSSLYPVGSVNPNVQNQFPVLDFNDLLGEMQTFDTQIVGFEEWLNHVYRLFDHLGYNNNHLNSIATDNWNPNVFPYPILAYNCIYQYYYRLDTREQFNQHSFNWDQFFNTPTVDSNNLGMALYDFIRIHYRPKENDYFTDAKISPIVDVLNLNVKNALEVTNNWLTRPTVSGVYRQNQSVIVPGRVGTDTGLADGSSSPLPIGSNPSTNITTNFGFASIGVADTPVPNYDFKSANGLDINTANIRAIFANEKLWSITGRARKHYDDQILAHFGYQVPHDIKHEISCFGHDHGLIHIGEVISTADTSTAGLGEIAGKGYGSSQNKPHKFTAPCHGVVMAIFSVVPDLAYGDYYMKVNAITNRFDLYQPEYDNLGMQPLFRYEGNITAPAVNRYDFTGWQYRYEQFKRRFNRVSKAFQGVGSLDSWMLDFAAPQTQVLANTPNFLEYLHKPQELNQIMLVNYIDTAWSAGATEEVVYDGDPFVVDGYIHCKKNSVMSDYSLPRLDA